MSNIALSHKSHTVIDESTIPVTVFTGFLGAGKTTIILNLLKQVSSRYNIVLLKNEFGDAETDSALARESHIKVTEMTNGCLCCVLVGQMKRALQEMKEKYNPDRVIIETSGSAFPAPIAWQIREMESEGFHLDSILTVIDCINFCGYEDTSYTARMQAQYTDLILLNKWEQVSERQLDIVIDHINELNTDTSKIKVENNGYIDPEVAFGIDTTLFKLSDKTFFATDGSIDTDIAGANKQDHHSQEVDLVEIRRSLDQSNDSSSCLLDPDVFTAFLKTLPADDIYRIKGIVRFASAVDDEADSSATVPVTVAANNNKLSHSGILYIVNHAFGRYTFTPLTAPDSIFDKTLVRITVMGIDLRMHLPALQAGFRASNDETKTSWAHTSH
ncbi:hypothetical protein GGI25_002650 [Coemansia spiralis]|uniref:CobW/HypB/UreG nucleotide-binding domain-containing protein n=2 Tax=Coemansia TaxID=4863 RepID=A0A9W8G8C6_9FUNG|nr:hypothetical protein EDC05_004456 [Coemansia umbellata]KAJ2620626.1 hypothetical protein GGI26_004858 [Coemansia sp. RSA 1358]KAJ2678146.1 hypothetical protein GGI25_002650 [Coemansia spiralis]